MVLAFLKGSIDWGKPKFLCGFMLSIIFVVFRLGMDSLSIS